jgi:hypothetical protein
VTTTELPGGAGLYTLPLTATLDEHVGRTDRVPFAGEPTWCRRINGAGQHQRLHLHRRGTADDGRQVWFVAGADTSPGDHIEVGPLPAHIVVDLDIASDQAHGGVRW